MNQNKNYFPTHVWGLKWFESFGCFFCVTKNVGTIRLHAHMKMQIIWIWALFIEVYRKQMKWHQWAIEERKISFIHTSSFFSHSKSRRFSAITFSLVFKWLGLAQIVWSWKGQCLSKSLIPLVWGVISLTISGAWTQKLSITGVYHLSNKFVFSFLTGNCLLS